MTDPSSASPVKRAAKGTAAHSSLLEDATFPDIDQTPTSPPIARNGSTNQRGGSTPSTAEMVVVQTANVALATPDEPELNFEQRKASPAPARVQLPLNSDLWQRLDVGGETTVQKEISPGGTTETVTTTINEGGRVIVKKTVTKHEFLYGGTK